MAISTATSFKTLHHTHSLSSSTKLPLPSSAFSVSFRPPRRPLLFLVSASLDAKPTVLVAEKLSEAGLKLLKEVANVDCCYNLTTDELCTKISHFDALIVRSGTKVSREVFKSSAGRLKVVGTAGVGYDNVDIAAATEFGCLVVNAPTANTAWSAAGKTLAFMGHGKVDSEVARRANWRNLMHLVACDKASTKMKKELHDGVLDLVALDVFTEEPPPKDEQVTKTPHLGASTVEAQEGVAIEIAKAVVGALKGELAATAINAPMVPAEVLTELKPFVDLAEKLGRLAVRLVAGGSVVKTVKVTYASSRAPDDLDTRLLRATVIKGLIEPISSVFVNLVNADSIAKQRGIRITEDKVILDGSPENPLEFIQVQIVNVESQFASAISESGDIKVEGRVKDGINHLTKVGSFEVDVRLEGCIILCRQVDQPGMIEKVGSILGQENVNVNFMSVGGIAPCKQAVMAIGGDDQPSKETLKKIGEITDIEEFVFLKL